MIYARINNFYFVYFYQLLLKELMLIGQDKARQATGFQQKC